MLGLILYKALLHTPYGLYHGTVSCYLVCRWHKAQALLDCYGKAGSIALTLAGLKYFNSSVS